jgi:site-specific recombinase XerC
MTTGTQRSRQPKPLAARAFQGKSNSFRLHLAAEGKAAKTVRNYTEAVQWFAAAHLLRETSCTGWNQVSGQGIQRWMVWLLGRYSDSYASNQSWALQQFFRWWVGSGGRSSRPDGQGLPASRGSWRSSCRCSLAENYRGWIACQARGFAQRRDQAIMSVFRSTGVRLSELAGIRFDPEDPLGSDMDLERREITIRGKGGKARIARIGHETARALDRYIRVRRRHAQTYRAELWLGVNNRGPLTASGICQMIVRRGRQRGMAVFPHRFRHHFSHTWLDRGGAEGDPMELNGWTSPQMLRRYGASARRLGAPHLRPDHPRQTVTGVGVCLIGDYPAGWLRSRTRAAWRCRRRACRFTVPSARRRVAQAEQAAPAIGGRWRSLASPASTPARQ